MDLSTSNGGCSKPAVSFSVDSILRKRGVEEEDTEVSTITSNPEGNTRFHSSPSPREDDQSDTSVSPLPYPRELWSGEAIFGGYGRILPEYLLRQGGRRLGRIFLLQTSENPEKSDYFHHLPATPTRTRLREDAVPGCLHARGACHETGSQRGSSSGLVSK